MPVPPGSSTQATVTRSSELVEAPPSLSRHHGNPSTTNGGDGAASSSSGSLQSRRQKIIDRDLSYDYRSDMLVPAPPASTTRTRTHAHTSKERRGAPYPAASSGNAFLCFRLSEQLYFFCQFGPFSGQYLISGFFPFLFGLRPPMGGGGGGMGQRRRSLAQRPVHADLAQRPVHDTLYSAEVKSVFNRRCKLQFLQFPNLFVITKNRSTCPIGKCKSRFARMALACAQRRAPEKNPGTRRRSYRAGPNRC